jgi:hypothetical protein
VLGTVAELSASFPSGAFAAAPGGRRQDKSVIVQGFLLCEIIFSERSDVTPRHYDCQGAGMPT